jgi:hypothetical protein
MSTLPRMLVAHNIPGDALLLCLRSAWREFRTGGGLFRFEIGKCRGRVLAVGNCPESRPQETHTAGPTDRPARPLPFSKLWLVNPPLK